MRVKTATTVLLMAGLGLGLSACYVAPGPDYAYYNSGYYAPPGYYAPAYYGPAYYSPSVGVYYSSGWRDRRWR